MRLNSSLTRQLSAARRTWEASQSPRPINASAKHCSYCGKKQDRMFEVEGPFTSAEINLNEYKKEWPKRTDGPIFRLPILRFIFCPPDYSSAFGWFTNVEKARCRTCEDRRDWHPEKKFVRKFGRFSIFKMWIKSLYSPFFTFTLRARD